VLFFSNEHDQTDENKQPGLFSRHDPPVHPSLFLNVIVLRTMFRHFIQIQTRPCYLLWFLFINSRKSKQIVDFSNTQGLLYFFFRRNRWTLRYRLFQRHPPLVRDKSHILKSILVSGLPFAVSSAPITLNWKATGKQLESNMKATGKKLERNWKAEAASWIHHGNCISFAFFLAAHSPLGRIPRWKFNEGCPAF